MGHFIDAITCQWPGSDVSNPTDPTLSTYISVDMATEKACNWFHIWDDNRRFKIAIIKIQNELDLLDTEVQRPIPYSCSQPCYKYSQKQTAVKLVEIMRRQAPVIPTETFEGFECWIGYHREDSNKHVKLDALIKRLVSESSGHFERVYSTDMLRSFDALCKKNPEAYLCGSIEDLKQELAHYLTQYKSHVNDVYQRICDCLQAGATAAARLARDARMWPRLSPTSLLGLIAKTKASTFPEKWIAAIVGYGSAISNLQRAERLLHFLGILLNF